MTTFNDVKLRGGGNPIDVPSSDFQTKRRYVELIIVPEEGGGFSGYVPSLPGVNSDGRGRLEAFRNLEEALHATIASYIDCGDAVPWLTEWPAETNREHVSKWVQVDDA
jgi:predicted RNase H-like HicB family nuclease